MTEPAPPAASTPWPASAVFGPTGLVVGGVPVARVAEQFGTPTFVMDEADLEARCSAYATAFPRVLFAVKALTTRATIRAALQADHGLLCATSGEVEACLRAGASADRLALHGNNKSLVELRGAIESGIGLIIVDNAEELARIDELTAAAHRVQPVLLRVAPGVEADTHAYLDTGGLESKFGTPIADGRALDALKAGSALSHIDLQGVHAHVGSQLFDSALLLRTVDLLFDLLSAAKTAFGFEARVLDIGGGFGVTYNTERPAEPEAIAAAVLAHVATVATSRGLSVPEVIVEPGRALVANPVITVYRVGVIKTDGEGRTLVAVDGGMSDNIRPALYGAIYSVARASAPRGSDSSMQATIVGRHCESGDVLAADVTVPENLATGDLLAFAATGAYCYSMANNYNRVGRPPIVGVRDGRQRLLLRREDSADLDRLEAEDPGPLPQIPMPAGVTIRRARSKDARAFNLMWQEVVAEGWLRSQELQNPVKTYKRLFKDAWSQNGAWILATRGGEILGLVSLTREQYAATRHVASLGIGVAASARGEGIGAALLSEAFRWAESVGVQRVILSVYPDNTRAMSLYRRFGFVEEGRFRQHSKRQNGYGDEILMGRWIGK